jgi:hypothetical protein
VCRAFPSWLPRISVRQHAGELLRRGWRPDDLRGEALDTFVCKRFTVLARCRAEAGRFRPLNMPGWFHPGQLMRKMWCRRRELNPHGLAACGFSYHFGFRRPAKGGFVVWTIPSPFLSDHILLPPPPTSRLREVRFGTGTLHGL